MKTQKVLSLVVEILVLEDGSCKYLMRHAQTGQVIEILSTPAEVQSLFCELSRTDLKQDSESNVPFPDAGVGA